MPSRAQPCRRRAKAGIYQKCVAALLQVLQRVLAEALQEPQSGSSSDSEPLTSLAIQKVWPPVAVKSEPGHGKRIMNYV